MITAALWLMMTMMQHGPRGEWHCISMDCKLGWYEYGLPRELPDVPAIQTESPLPRHPINDRMPTPAQFKQACEMVHGSSYNADNDQCEFYSCEDKTRILMFDEQRGAHCVKF